MGNGLITATGLTAQQNVVKEHRSGQEPALTLPQRTEELTVRESLWRRGNATWTRVLLMVAGQTGKSGPCALFLVEELATRQKRELVPTQLQHMAVQPALEQTRRLDPVTVECVET